MAQVYRINLHFSNLRTVPFTTTSPLKSPSAFLSYFSAAKSMRPRAMEKWEVPRRSKSEDRMSEGWRLVSCARFGHEAASPDKGLGRNSSDRHLAANGMDSHYHFGNHSSNSKDKEGPIEDNNRAPPPLRLLTLPTILTLARVAAVPLLVATFYKDGWWATTATTTLFIAAAITDWLDGYIARKMRLGTAFGAFLDPVADKLMVAATLVLLCSRPLEGPVFGQVPWLLTVPSIAIIGREITMSAVREWAASQNSRVLEAVAVNNLGKWKTATQMTALIILLATRDSSLSRADILVSSGVVLLYISAGLAVWSLVVYMRKISRLLLK